MLTIPCTIEMTFEFRAHHPSAYLRFTIFLLVLIAINIFLIALIYPSLKSMNDAAERSVIFIFPWLFFLLLPSTILGVIIYRSFVKTFRLTVENSFLIVELMRKNNTVRREKKILWSELKSFRIVDFEDNHYCNLEFSNKKNNLVLHRDSGDFEKFYEELKQHSPIIA